MAGVGAGAGGRDCVTATRKTDTPESAPATLLPASVPPDGCAYCCVLYGSKPDYALLLLVLPRRLALLGAAHPLLVLPTPDVPQKFLEAARLLGCQV